MVWIIIAFGFLYVILTIWNVLEDDRIFRYFTALILTILAIMLVGLFWAYENRNTPTAMDVYQGKTTLEITYRDSIPVDSIVVFKEVKL